MLVCLVLIISRLDSHSKFQKFTLFSSRHVGVQQIEVHQHGGYISTNISTLGERTHLKLGELSSLFISYNLTMSWIYPLNGQFKLIFAWQWTHSIQPELPASLLRLASGWSLEHENSLFEWISELSSPADMSARRKLRRIQWQWYTKINLTS